MFLKYLIIMWFAVTIKVIKDQFCHSHLALEMQTKRNQFSAIWDSNK